MSVIAALATFITSARPEAGSQDIATRAVADCFGCILAGVDSDAAQRTRRALGRMGRGPAPVFGTGITLPASYAALANAVAAHALDLDDWEEPGNTHPTAVLLPALLAAASCAPVDGRALRDAWIVGTEIIMRLGEALTLDHYRRGFHSTATLGVIGAAGAVSRLLGLSADRAAHALSLATSQAMGLTEQFGTDAKPLQAGFAARSGLEAAQLAAAGAEGQHQVIDGKRGLAGLLGRRSARRFARMCSRLAAPRFALEEYGIALKPWPSCGYSHRMMAAARSLRQHLAGRIGDIAAIDMTLPDFHLAVMPFRHPQNRSQALFSLPACTAQILLHGTLTPADGAREFWSDPELARLIDLTRITPVRPRNPMLNFDPQQPDRLCIRLCNGETLEATCAWPPGTPGNPVDDNAIAKKFAVVTGRNAQDFRTLMTWPEARDVAAFFANFAAGPDAVSG